MFDHMRHWSRRVNRSFAGGGFEEVANLDENQAVRDYIINLRNTVDRFMGHISTQLRGKPQKSAASQHLSREHHERMRVLNDKEFLRTNCRVPPPQERPSSGGKGQSDDFDNPYATIQ